MIQNGEILGGMYQIIQEIGQGGTGIIYLAEHLRLQKRVVVKKIKDNFVGQVNGRAEVDILKKLHHTCLPQVYDFLVLGSSVYTVMEYVQGYDLQQYLDQGYQFPEQTVRQWLLQLSEVLEYLHSQKPPIFHSDIKPANLMVTPQGNICLIDFNISLDGENSKDIQGISPWYAAPEQSEKAQNVLYGRKDRIVLDGRMDIYSLGATFYRVMTGRLPSPDKTQIRDLVSMNLPYSDGLKAVVSKAMRKSPSARFQTAKQMRKALVEIERMDPVYRRYGRIQVGSVFVWLLCVIAGVLCLYYGNWQNRVEQWRQAYRELYVSAEAQAETEIVSKATEMLNEYRYKGYLKQHEDERAEVLHTLGESYFRQEKFKEAASCYQEAWELMPEAGGYCKDYVVSLVRSGQLSKAGQVIRSAEGLRDLSQEEQQLIQAEIAWMNEDAETAVSVLEELLGAADAGGSSDVLQSAWLLQADIYESQGEYSKAVASLEYAQKNLPSKEILRHLGQTAMDAAMASERETNQKAYIQKALTCYQNLNQSSAPSYYDRLNLALVQRASEEYRNSNDTLREMAQLYPDDYVVAMWMCYNYLDLGAAGESSTAEPEEEEEEETENAGELYAEEPVAENSKEEQSLLNDLLFRYRDCKHMYDASGAMDQDMEALIEIMQDLGV